jgi:hypothetical protein
MPRDPLRQRPNPEIPEILRLLQKSFAELLEETDYTRRIGRARVLVAHLESLIDEPELVPGPVREGAGSGARFLLPASEFPEGSAVPFLREYPFDRPGDGEGLCFFYAGRRVSPLYTGPALDPYRFPQPLHQSGPWVYSLEKRVATKTDTDRRVPASAIEEIAETKGKRNPVGPNDDTEMHFVLCDPRGFDDDGPPTSLEVGRYTSLRRATSAAEQLSETLGIRMLVATVRARFCTY